MYLSIYWASVRAMRTPTFLQPLNSLMNEHFFHAIYVQTKEEVPINEHCGCSHQYPCVTPFPELEKLIVSIMSRDKESHRLIMCCVQMYFLFIGFECDAFNFIECPLLCNRRKREIETPPLFSLRVHSFVMSSS